MIKFRLLMCLGLAMFLALPVFSTSECPELVGDESLFMDEGLFTYALQSDYAPYLNATKGSIEPHVIRERVARVDFDKIHSDIRAGKRNPVLHMNLFEDVNFSCRVDDIILNDSGSMTLRGKETGNGIAKMILTLRGNIMFGSFSRGNKSYVINFLAEDFHKIQETAHSAFPKCKLPETDNRANMAKIASDNLSRTNADDGSNIDVMVVYNAAARSAVGGTAAMETKIDQALAETNTGYGDSQINFTMTCVHKAEVVYSETSFNWSTCLSRLRGKTDGYMDEVHTLRDTYKADCVLMVVNNGSYCGLASTIMASESEAFALAYHSCITGYYSFAHEIGHLQGARHDRCVDSTENSPDPYNHGHTESTSWRTIMAYGTCCSNCTRVNHWSNPNINHSGAATGTPGGAGVGENNAQTLMNYRVTCANWRDSGGTIPPVTYCTSSSTNYNYEYISRVQIGGLDKSSGGSTYSNYTTDPATTLSGSVSVTLTPWTSSTYNEYWEIYIDANGDGDFSDAGEKVFSGNGTSAVTGSFTAPSGLGGETRMRVIMQWNAFRNTSCGTFTYGEVEDYTVNLL
jgi:hypothetical protein